MKKKKMAKKGKGSALPMKKALPMPPEMGAGPMPIPEAPPLESASPMGGANPAGPPPRTRFGSSMRGTVPTDDYS